MYDPDFATQRMCNYAEELFDYVIGMFYNRLSNKNAGIEYNYV